MMFSIGILSFVFLIDPYCVSKLKCSRILQGSQTSVLVVNHLFKWEKTRLPILILGAHLGHLWSFYSLLTGRFAIQNYSLKSITNDWPNWLDIIPVFFIISYFLLKTVMPEFVFGNSYMHQSLYIHHKLLEKN